MKNIEKYPSTKDALEAYFARDKGVSTTFTFREWCDREYEETKPLTLLEVAKAIENCIRTTPLAVRWSRPYGMLTDVIKFEETRPKRNYERFATAEEATQCFRIGCGMHRDCDYCTLRDTYMNCHGRLSCFAKWLYSTADVFKKEEENNEEAK